MADASPKMDNNPQEDDFHESQTLTPKKSEQKYPQVSEKIVDVSKETESQDTDSGRSFNNLTRRSVEDTKSISDKGAESDDSNDLSFRSDFYIKNKNFLGVIGEHKKRPSSLSSLCDRINHLNLEEEGSFQSDTQENGNEYEILTLQDKNEDLEEYFPASSIKSEESSGEFLPAISVIKLDETFTATEENIEAENTEENKELSFTVSEVKLNKDNINKSVKELSLAKDLLYEDIKKNKSIVECVNFNELSTEKIESTEVNNKDQSASGVNKVIGIADSNQISSAKEFGETVESIEVVNNENELINSQLSLSIKLDSINTSKETIEVNNTDHSITVLNGSIITSKEPAVVNETDSSIKIFNESINTHKEPTNVNETEPSIKIFNESDIKRNRTFPESVTTEISPTKLLEISVNISPNELDKTTSCINEDELILHDNSFEHKNFEDEKSINNITNTVTSRTESDNLDSTFTADSEVTESNDTTPTNIEIPCLNGSNNTEVSITGSPEAVDISEDTFGFSKIIGVSEIINSEQKIDTNIINVSQSTNTDNSSKITSVSQSTNTSFIDQSPNIVSVSQSTNTDSFPKVTSVSQSTNTSCIDESPDVVSVSQSTNTDDNLNTQAEDKNFGPDTNCNFKMADMVEKLNQQQAEISDLKLKLNAAQQHNATLELQIRQNEEIVIKAQAEALKTEQNYQQEVKQLKQKINENSKIIEKDRIRELEEQLKEAKAKEAKLLAELSQKTKDDVNYQKIMDQYEITLKNRVAEAKKLQEENETIRTHLTNLELAFSDVHSKYEKTKASLQGVKANEESLLQDLEVAQSTNIQHEERYESLKAHARTQIEKSNKEIHDLKEQHEQELSKLRAFSRRLEIKVSSLEVSLQQKTAECEQLSALCDEVTGKKV